MIFVAMMWGLPAPHAPVAIKEVVSAHMPAAQAGLRPGDVITAVDGKPLSTRRYDGSYFVTETIRAHAQKPLTFSILRGGKIRL